MVMMYANDDAEVNVNFNDAILILDRERASSLRKGQMP